MGANTDQELKQILKSLFAEKKRAKELQKKNHAATQNSEENNTLQLVCQEKEKENVLLKEQLEKVRPALNLLIQELKQTRAELECLKSSQSVESLKEKEAQLTQALSLAQEKNQKLEGEILTDYRNEIAKLELLLENEKKRNLNFEKEKKYLETSLEKLSKSLEEKQQTLLSFESHEKKQMQCLEEERVRLVEKLAESFTQVERQNDFIKILREKELQGEEKRREYESYIEDLKKQLVAKEEELKKKNSLKSLDKGDRELQQTAYEITINDLHLKLSAAVANHEQKRGEWEQELEKFKEQLEAKEQHKEHLLEKGYYAIREFLKRHYLLVEETADLAAKYSKKCKKLCEFEKKELELKNALQNFKIQCQEKDAEIRKAQLHLAKKVKETTVLGDLLEKHKLQCTELATACAKQKQDLVQLHAQQLAEKEKRECLEEEWKKQNQQLLDMQQMKKDYEAMLSTFSLIKNLLNTDKDESS